MIPSLASVCSTNIVRFCSAVDSRLCTHGEIVYGECYDIPDLDGKEDEGSACQVADFSIMQEPPASNSYSTVVRRSSIET